MNQAAPYISRRQLLAGIWRPNKDLTAEGASRDSTPRVAVIQGRHCLAYRSLFCSSCVERCPIDGAIEVRDGVPQVVASICTGCGDCQAICPAPVNAVMLIDSSLTSVGK
ncbi:hypothetical protein NG895_10615 [Aeoliella sp. ICT_H6.2]|uniref:4Fe-4S ferredoxin-type domain-containing protein n=1 Tax=Aeoliella straminimaris TaxID=2954799 RepID=A0A9X2FDL0_9BACT|nr:hypothetical protein [Aeoliella straminimaris]MCO6044359.1 hypothetical protein [Aeoliella straminimaris]